MRSKLTLIIVLFAAAACSGDEDKVQSSDRILAISFPSEPNPPTKNLVRGTGEFGRVRGDGSLESLLSEEFLGCGIRNITWTSTASDGGSRLILPDNERSRTAVSCVAKTFPQDFYVVPERASKSDIAALTQTPR